MLIPLCKTVETYAKINIHSYEVSVLWASSKTFPSEIMPNEKTSQDSVQPQEKPANIAAFFTYGFVTQLIAAIFVSSAQDVLSGTSLPSTLLLLAQELPYLISCAILPNFVERVPQLAVNVTVFVLFTVGLMLMSLADKIELKLMGVSINGLGLSIGDVFFFGSHCPVYGYHGSRLQWRNWNGLYFLCSLLCW